MLWLVIIGVTAVLLIVLTYRRPINTAGVQAMRPVSIDPPARPAQTPTEQPAAPPPVEVTTMNFNDVFGAKRAPASDQPNA